MTQYFPSQTRQPVPIYGTPYTGGNAPPGSINAFDPNTGLPLPRPATTPTVDRTPAISGYQRAQEASILSDTQRAEFQRQADQQAASVRQARIDAINTMFAPRV